MKALSIRQPWAWLIVNGHKDVENRDWHTHHRGQILIHAGKAMTRDDYEDCRGLANRLNIEVPAHAELDRGGIVGQAEIVACVTTSQSPWFFGRFGFVVRNAEPLPFYPCRGALGFFDIEIPS